MPVVFLCSKINERNDTYDCGKFTTQQMKRKQILKNKKEIFIMKKVIIYVKPNNGFASATEVKEIDMRVYADTLPCVIVLNVDANLSEESINEYVSFI